MPAFHASASSGCCRSMPPSHWPSRKNAASRSPCPTERFDIREITEDPEMLPAFSGCSCATTLSRGRLSASAFIKAIVGDVAGDAGHAGGGDRKFYPEPRDAKRCGRR